MKEEIQQNQRSLLDADSIREWVTKAVKCISIYWDNTFCPVCGIEPRNLLEYLEECENHPLIMTTNNTKVYGEGYTAGYNQAKVDSGLMSQEEADKILLRLK